MSNVFRSWLQGGALAALLWSGAANADVHIRLERQTDGLVLMTLSGSIDPGVGDGFQFETGSKVAFFLNDIFGVQPDPNGPILRFLSLAPLAPAPAVGGDSLTDAWRYNSAYGLMGNSIMFTRRQGNQPVDLTVGTPFSGAALLGLTGLPETFAAIGTSGDITWGASPFTPEAGLGRGVKIGTWDMVASVPEPANAALLLGGIAGLAAWLRRQRRC